MYWHDNCIAFSSVPSSIHLLTYLYARLSADKIPFLTGFPFSSTKYNPLPCPHIPIPEILDASTFVSTNIFLIQV